MTRSRSGTGALAGNLLRLLCLSASVVAGCSRPEPPAPAPVGHAARAAPTPIAAAPSESEWPAPAVYFQGRLRKLTAWGDELRERVDPERDGWPTEAFAERAEDLLRRSLARALADDGSLARELEALGADAFEGATDLVPATLSTVFEDENYVVRRAPAIDAERRAPEELARQADAYVAALGGASERYAYLDLTGVRPLENERFDTHVVLRVAGELGAGAIQHNLTWRVVWRAAAKPKDPRIESLALVRFEEVRAKRRPLADLSRAVFGGDPCWQEEIRRGSGDYHMRQDRLSAQPYLGMHGLAVGDVNGDGLEDLYLSQPGGQPNRLWIHQPDGTAVDTAAEASVDFLDNCGPALLLDFDNDGDLDLAVAARENVLVAWNDGGGRFSDTIVLVAKDDPEITSMSAGDPDRDGDLDIYACRYVGGGVAGGAPTPYYAADNGASNLYWKNEGGRRFREAASEVGLDLNNTRFSLALTFEDYDEDGDDDLYVVNDFGRNSLYENQGGRFVGDVAERAGAVDQAAGMGVACGDVDVDGDVDLYVTNMYSPEGARIAAQPQFMPERPETRDDYLYHARGNTLLLANGDGTYTDATERAGVAPGGWAWGSAFFDLNGDGLLDIAVPNGFSSHEPKYDLASFFWRGVVANSPAAMPVTERYLEASDAIRHFTMFEGHPWNGDERDYAYLNLGEVRFADVSAVVGTDFLDDGRSVAPLDWDEDGRVDLLFRNRTGPRLRLMRNAAETSNRWVAFELAGTRLNRDAIGARVTLEAGGRKVRQGVYAAQGFMCGGSRRLHFGLGRADAIDKVEVRWPDGTSEVFPGVTPGARWRLVEGSGRPERVGKPPQRELAAQRTERLHVTLRGVERIPVIDRLPMGEIEVAAFEGPARKIATLAREGLVLSVAPGTDALSRASVESVARRLQENGVAHVVLATDEARTIADTRRWLAGFGAAKSAGPADKRFLQALEVLMIEVLGPFDRLPFPLHLLFDRQGELCAIHCGASPAASVAADALVVRALEPGRSTAQLTGGHWARHGGRTLDVVAEIFKVLGRTELSRWYEGRMIARNPKPPHAATPAGAAGGH